MLIIYICCSFVKWHAGAESWLRNRKQLWGLLFLWCRNMRRPPPPRRPLECHEHRQTLKSTDRPSRRIFKLTYITATLEMRAPGRDTLSGEPVKTCIYFHLTSLYITSSLAARSYIWIRCTDANSKRCTYRLRIRFLTSPHQRHNVSLQRKKPTRQNIACDRAPSQIIRLLSFFVFFAWLSFFIRVRSLVSTAQRRKNSLFLTLHNVKF